VNDARFLARGSAALGTAGSRNRPEYLSIRPLCFLFWVDYGSSHSLRDLAFRLNVSVRDDSQCGSDARRPFAVYNIPLDEHECEPIRLFWSTGLGRPALPPSGRAAFCGPRTDALPHFWNVVR